MLNIYLYAICATSLSVFYFATLTTIGAALQLLPGVTPNPIEALDLRGTIANGLGFAIIAFPLWWSHWRWLRKQFRKSTSLAIAWHRFYLFTIICLSAVAVLFGGGLGTAAVLKLGLGTGDSPGRILAGGGLYLCSLLLSSAIWLHHWRQFRGGLMELL